MPFDVERALARVTGLAAVVVALLGLGHGFSVSMLEADREKRWPPVGRADGHRQAW